jgi:hypothetical protein
LLNFPRTVENTGFIKKQGGGRREEGKRKEK